MLLITGLRLQRLSNGSYHTYSVTSMRQNMLGGREFGNTLVSWLWAGSSSHSDNALYDIAKRVHIAGALCDTYFTWRRHDMKTFSALLVPLCRESPVTVDSPHKRPVIRSWQCRALIFLGCSKKYLGDCICTIACQNKVYKSKLKAHGPRPQGYQTALEPQLIRDYLTINFMKLTKHSISHMFHIQIHTHA